MDQNRLKNLLAKYLNNTITKTELSILIDELNLSDHENIDSAIDELLANVVLDKKSLTEERKNLLLKKTFEAIVAPDQKKRKSFSMGINPRGWWRIAATFLLISAIAIFFLGKFNFTTANLISSYPGKKITLPNHNQTVVKLHDGRNLSLLEADAKTLKNEGIAIQKDKKGNLLFVIHEISDASKYHNTFSNPKGTSSHLLLADGTNVWLNSGASITYPLRFDKKNRSVVITGEAYFEVYPNSARPFTVSVGQTKIKVLGTHFNVNNQLSVGEVHTTLLEGSVQIITGKEQLKLSPGNQAVSNERSGEILTSAANVGSVLSWRNGYFRFSDDDIYTVLNKLNVWYDIKGFEVKSETNDRFTGSVQRTNDLSDLLKQLEKVSDYKFILKDGRVIVMN